MQTATCPISLAISLLLATSLPNMSSAQQDSHGTAQSGLLSCEGSKFEPNAWYVGPYKGEDSALSGIDLARDAYCADRFKREKYPNGFVTIYGSSKIDKDYDFPKPSGSSFSLMIGKDDPEEQERNRTYAGVKAFAYAWTNQYGEKYPILTGAGPGLMEAASRGAIKAVEEAKGARKSVGYTTYYDRVDNWKNCTSNCYKGCPSFSRYPFNKDDKNCPANGAVITSDGLIFSSVSIRETAMILHSAAIVIAPGGTGTEWETYQILEMLKSKQLKKVPIFFVGQRIHWNSLVNRIHDMEDRGTISAGDIAIEFAQCPTDLVNRLSFRLGLTQTSPPEFNIACATKSKYESESLREFGLN